MIPAAEARRHDLPAPAARPQLGRIGRVQFMFPISRPSDATEDILSIPLPSNVQLDSATSSQGPALTVRAGVVSATRRAIGAGNVGDRDAHHDAGNGRLDDSGNTQQPAAGFDPRTL